jgi:hypothetical protein
MPKYGNIEHGERWVGEIDETEGDQVEKKQKR